MDLTVIIPTRDRREILFETLAMLEPQLGAGGFEAIVVDDGSRDGTQEAVRRLADSARFPLRLIEQDGRGPAAGRNRGLAAARAPVCLFIDDDKFPAPDLLVRHRDFHGRRPEPEVAMLGYVGVASTPPPTPFMRWLADLHFDFAGIEDDQNAGGDHFFSGNVSVKTAFARDAGGFDERFPSPAHEDIDLGLRLEKRGMRLVYDRRAVVDHCHPTDLPGAIDRYYRAGPSLAYFVERYPGFPVARRPDARHRVKAAALTVLAALGVRTPRVRRETWRFLCHEAAREGFWDAVDGRFGGGDGLRIGGTLARLASRDPAACMPPRVEPAARKLETAIA
ncbi:MAG TPA: glycosyltransferase family A protein [Thermoleophilaceae bacterium]|nr:glycosyltransferase family A protein [Thermoleophilaceae bacterium]